jgi:hypothetical protein
LKEKKRREEEKKRKRRRSRRKRADQATVPMEDVTRNARKVEEKNQKSYCRVEKRKKKLRHGKRSPL